MPEPYFLRTPYQLRIMGTPNGFGQIERSLVPFYGTASLEAVALRERIPRHVRRFLHRDFAPMKLPDYCVECQCMPRCMR
jgi:hypothetical protein